MIDPADVARMNDLADMMLRRATDDPAAFAQVAGVIERLQVGMPTATLGLLKQGYSWGDIANELGVRKQSAHRKYRPARP